MNLRKLIRETLGDMRFPTGALTSQAHSLILFANHNEWMQEFIRDNGPDKEPIFHRAVEVYRQKFGEDIGGDPEIVFYDFMAHYKTPPSLLKNRPPSGKVKFIGFDHDTKLQP